MAKHKSQVIIHEDIKNATNAPPSCVAVKYKAKSIKEAKDINIM